MKRILTGIAIVAASLTYSLPIYANEYGAGQSDEYGMVKSYDMKSQKDQCLVVAKNCSSVNESVMQRAERLKKEIEKGAAVYTPEELKSFQDQLNWINSESGIGSGGVY